MTIFGTRPEAIKMAPIVQQLEAQHEQIQSVVCVTAQHRDMLDQVLELFNIAPTHDLDLMEHNQTPTQVAARVLSELESLLREVRPDWVLVQGDTTTVMAASIAAHYQRVRVAHVEAGLRTYDRANPFPEEMNRVVADHVADLCFAPTDAARRNLAREGVPPARIFVTGNSVIDALLQMADRALPAETRAWLTQQGLDPVLDAEGNYDRRLILVTAHRRENHGQPIRDICQALRQIAVTHPDQHIVYPVHRNPNIWGPVRALLGDVPGITLLPPVDYLTLVYLMKRSKLILTDSGGIQEEASSLNAPVLVLRDTTERPEAVDAGAAQVVGTDPHCIALAVSGLLNNDSLYQAMASAANPYGDGMAAKRIVKVLTTGTCDEFSPSQPEARQASAIDGLQSPGRIPNKLSSTSTPDER